MKETLSDLKQPTDVSTQVADQTTVDTKAKHMPTKTPTLMGEELQGERTGLVASKSTAEAADVASKVLQTDATKRLAVKNATLAGVIKHPFFLIKHPLPKILHYVTRTMSFRNTIYYLVPSNIIHLRSAFPLARLETSIQRV